MLTGRARGSPLVVVGVRRYDHKSDVWALGCVLYELLTLRPAFVADRMTDLWERIQAGAYLPIDRYSRARPRLGATSLAQWRSSRVGWLSRVSPVAVRPRVSASLSPLRRQALSRSAALCRAPPAERVARPTSVDAAAARMAGAHPRRCTRPRGRILGEQLAVCVARVRPGRRIRDSSPDRPHACHGDGKP